MAQDGLPPTERHGPVPSLGRELAPQRGSPLGLQNCRNKKHFDLQYVLGLALLRGPNNPSVPTPVQLYYVLR